MRPLENFCVNCNGTEPCKCIDGQASCEQCFVLLNNVFDDAEAESMGLTGVMTEEEYHERCFANALTV